MPKVNHVYKYYSFVEGLIHVQNDQERYKKIELRSSIKNLNYFSEDEISNLLN